MYQNNRIRIRPYRPDDQAGMFQCISASIPEMKPHLPWVHDNYSWRDSEMWIAWAQQNWRLGAQYDFVIEERDTDVFLGGVGLLNVNNPPGTAELGYWLRSDYTGQGLSFAAAKLATQFAKDELGLERIIIYMAVENKASQAIAKKLGADYLDTKRKYEIINDVPLDCAFYSLDLAKVKSPQGLAIFNK